ncbi:Chorismate synthase [Dissostichus eleginoides]|uniref:Chorismate synthase n=1 Tax=Dissostichus eleginoides TaxID=100907 RepID=A0AAD9BSX7_DISEL|nr:Chorismate synthase [Dissostichus eleginoides]
MAVIQQSGQQACAMITHVIAGNECGIERNILSPKWDQPHRPICPVTGDDREVSALLDAREGETDSVFCRELIEAEGFPLPASA